MNNTSWQLIAWVFTSYVRPHLRILAIAILFMVGQATAQTAVAKMIEPITNGIISENISAHFFTCALLVIVYLLKAATNYGQTYAMGWISQRIIADMRKNLFSHLIKMDISYFHQYNTGQFLSYFTNDIHKVNAAISRVAVTIGRDFFIVVGLTGLMFYQDAFLATLYFTLSPIAITIIVLLGKKMRKISHKQQTVFGDMTSNLGQVFQGIRNVKAYGNETIEIKRNHSIIDRLFDLSVKNIKVHALNQPIMEILGSLTAAATIAYGGYQVHQGHLNIGIFISFITSMLFLYPAAKRLSQMNIHLQEGLAAAQRVWNVFEEKAQIVNSPQANIISSKKPEICFHDVSFKYDETSKKTALENVSFIVKPLKKIALVGPSGAGKSTILNLLLRFYDAQGGSITIDNHNIRDMDLRSLRKHFALVSQDIVLLDDTVYNNIAYGNVKASKKEVLTAAQKAAADSFIENLPEKYDTQIGENGVKLSGGQKQRIAIARAFLRNAPILLLDEATSALDTKSERLIHKALETLSENKTTIMIAHRLSTIDMADVIIVIDHGQIVEMGSHTQLMKKKGLYYELYKQQQGQNKGI